MEHGWTVIAGVGGWLASSGLIAWGLKLWIERRLKRAEADADEKSRYRKERYEVDDAFRHAVGRCLFWIRYGVEELEEDQGKSYWNGELKDAYKAVEDAEARRKELDRRQLADANGE